MDAVRSLVVLDTLVKIGTVVVVHHTGSCYVSSYTGLGKGGQDSETDDW
jgi:hypothetical protein